jgi:hypothetical protein
MPSDLHDIRAVKRTAVSDQAAAHVRILPETFSALVRANIFPQPDEGQWHPHLLDRVVEALIGDGLPNYRRLPYSHRVRRRIEGEPARLHEGWRHGHKSKLINEPFHSPAYIRQWFELERAYAAEWVAQSQAADSRASTGWHRSSKASQSFSVVSLSDAGKRGVKNSQAAREGSTRLSMESEFLTDLDLYHRWRGKIALETLANWRSARTGPPFIKIGKTPLYPQGLLAQWETQHMIICDPVDVIDREGEAV